jgi:hypothetical protein
LTKPVSNIIIVSKKVNAANAALVRRLGSAKTKMDPFDPAPLFIDRASPPGAWLKPARSTPVKPGKTKFAGRGSAKTNWKPQIYSKPCQFYSLAAQITRSRCLRHFDS